MQNLSKGFEIAKFNAMVDSVDLKDLVQLIKNLFLLYKRTCAVYDKLLLDELAERHSELQRKIVAHNQNCCYPKKMPQQINYDTSKFKLLLHNYRVEHEWRHAQASEFWGITRPLYTQYENGKTRIPLEFCLVVCEKLGLELNNYITKI